MLNPFRRRAIKNQVQYLKENRPLPIGRKEFEAWSEEIFKLSEIPGLTLESCRFALAEMILHVKPTQSFECYGHFVHSLRKGAANQTAHALMQEIKKAHEERKAKEEEQKEVATKLVTPSDEKVLENTEIQTT